MKITNQQKLFLWAGLSLITLFLFYISFVRGYLVRGAAQAELLILRDQIAVHMPRHQVLDLFNGSSFTYLSLHRGDPNSWVAATPDIVGARNWVLLIDFKNDLVSGVRVRRSDSSTKSPQGAPAEKE